MFPVEQFPSGVCRTVDPDAMYPTPSDEQGTAFAKEVCEFCVHKADCLEAALLLPATRDFGVFGATTEQERRALRRKRKREQAKADALAAAS